MPAVTRAARNASRRFVSTIPTPRRFLRCVACGTIKKERNYALCSECYKLNGQLDRGLFTCFARHAEREAPEYSYRKHPEFDKACRIYARRRERAQALAAIDAALPRYAPRFSDSRNRYELEQYDGIGSHELDDLLDWLMYGTEMPKLERSEHRELSDAEIAIWDARVDDWAKARGFSLAGEPTPELQPWGYWMQIDGAMVWTDDAN